MKISKKDHFLSANQSFKLVAIVLAITILPALSEFEKWTYKEGRSVNMEFVRFLEVDGEKAAEFKLINGRLKSIKLSELTESDVTRITTQPTPKESMIAVIPLDPKASIYDKAIHKLRSEQKVSDEEIEICREDFLKYFDELAKKNRTGSNTAFSEDDRLDYYIRAIKMAIIDYPQHGGWPFRSEIRMTVLSGLKKRIEEKNDPFVVFCAIFPALDANDYAYAAESMNKLKSDDPFLAKLTERWVVNFWAVTDARKKRIEPFLKATGIKLPDKNAPE